MKWTMTKINKMTTEELVNYINKVEPMPTLVYGQYDKRELRNKLITLINRGLV